MAAPPVRRADFLMALAYATDLATGHSRDFALRSCETKVHASRRRPSRCGLSGAAAVALAAEHALRVVSSRNTGH
jgi:hypothetical protein